MSTPPGAQAAGLARTIVVSGTGGPSLSFEWPAGVELTPEAIFADIDATGAGADVTATLTIQEQSGVVIAKKAQGSKITAGAPGSATWGLRLPDDTAAVTPASAATYAQFRAPTQNLANGAPFATADVVSSGVNVVASSFVIVTAGLYLFDGFCAFKQAGPAAALGTIGWSALPSLPGAGNLSVQTINPALGGGQNYECTISASWRATLAAGEIIAIAAFTTYALVNTFGGRFSIQLVG